MFNYVSVYFFNTFIKRDLSINDFSLKWHKNLWTNVTDTLIVDMQKLLTLLLLKLIFNFNCMRSMYHNRLFGVFLNRLRSIFLTPPTHDLIHIVYFSFSFIWLLLLPLWFIVFMLRSSVTKTSFAGKLLNQSENRNKLI